MTYFKMPGGLKVQLYQPRYVKKSARKTVAKKAAAKTPRKSAAKTRKAPKKAKR